MKKIVWILLILFTVIGCGRVKDGGADVYGTNTGYDPYNGGVFIYYGKPFSGTVDVVTETLFGGTTDHVIGSYKVKDGKYISQFEKIPYDPSKEHDKNRKYYSGKLKYNEKDGLHHGTIKLNNEMFGEVEGSWNINPALLAKIMQKDTFFGLNVTSVLNGTANLKEAKIRSFFLKGYKSSLKAKNNHILEYKMTDYKDDEIYIEYEAGKMDKDGKFEVEITIYKHTVKNDDDQWTGMDKFKETDLYKNTKKITIQGLAKYRTYKRKDFVKGSVTVTDYSTIILDPTTTYTVSGGFGKTYYDDMLYKVQYGNPGVVDSSEFSFDLIKTFDSLMEKIFITYKKEDFIK